MKFDNNRIILVNTSYDYKSGTQSNKFWIAEFDDNFRVTTRWGRIGHSGQSKYMYSRHNEAAASNAIERLAHEKMRKKGYSPIGEEEFELKTVIAKAIGTTNTMLTCAFAKVLPGRKVAPAQPHELQNPDIEICIFVEVYFKKSGETRSYVFRSDGNVHTGSINWGNQPCYFSGVASETPELVKVKDAVSEILASGKIGA